MSASPMMKNSPAPGDEVSVFVAGCGWICEIRQSDFCRGSRLVGALANLLAGGCVAAVGFWALP